MARPERRFASGIFCISLDFELYYGISDLAEISRVRPRMEAARRAVSALLEIFREYEIHATWATVGMLFARSRQDLESIAPERPRPRYDDSKLSAYRLLSEVGDSEEQTPWLLASSLIERIRRTPWQEIATHTFSHFYALEPGASLESFDADLRAAVRIAARSGDGVQSIVFPRNQYGPRHLRICRLAGLRAFRGNPPHWMHAPAGAASESAWRRAARLLDTHAAVSNTNLYVPEDVRHPSGLANVAASRFLRPVDARAAWPALVRRRIRGELRDAAETGRLYHLWWHPHNFGGALDANLDSLRRALDCFAELRETKAMRSLSMREVAMEAGASDEEDCHDRARRSVDALVP